MQKCIYLVLVAAFITIAESSIGLTSRCCRLDTGHDIDLLTKIYYYGKDVRCVVERTFLMI